MIVFQGVYQGMALLTNSTTSTAENPINKFSVNVSRERITVNFDEAESVKIIDMLGNTLFNKSITEPIISIPNIYPAGNYLCVVKSGKTEYTQKFQVVR
jgi:hypothetical protein